MAGRKTMMAGTKILVDWAALQEVLECAEHAAVCGDWSSLKVMLSQQFYNEPGNPIRKLINTHNAAIGLLNTKPKGEA